MKVRDEVTAAKLRGGFYTPDSLVDLCLRRIVDLAPREQLDLLEPSVGDGAFLRGLGRSDLAARGLRVHAVELVESEAHKSGVLLRNLGFAGQVENRSAVEWAFHTDQVFDAAVGNPPFVRFQFVEQDDRDFAALVGDKAGVSLGGVSNLWLPVLLGSLLRLKEGGAFAFASRLNA